MKMQFFAISELIVLSRHTCKFPKGGIFNHCYHYKTIHERPLDPFLYILFEWLPLTICFSAVTRFY